MMYYSDFMLSAKIHGHTFTMLRAGLPGGVHPGETQPMTFGSPLNNWTIATPVSNWLDFYQPAGILQRT